MKKKLITMIFAIVCAVACAFGLVACSGGGESTSVSCKVTPAEHVEQVWIGQDWLGQSVSLENGSWTLTDQVEKKEQTLKFALEPNYVIGTLKMLINGTETALTPVVDESNNTVEGNYSCKYTPTADFEITFSGEAALAERKVTLALNWWHYDRIINNPEATEDNKTEQRLLKEEVKNSVYVKVIVNDEAKAAFNGITLKQYETVIKANPYITVTAKDKVEVRVYTTSADLTADLSSIDGRVTEGNDSLGGLGFNNFYGYIENSFAKHENEKVSYLKISSCNVDDVITIVPNFYAATT